VTLLVLAITLLFFKEPATAALNQWTGTRSWSTASRAATIRVLTLLVVVWLVYTLNPEVRAFLLVVDFLGVDLFLMLIFFQGQEILGWAVSAILAPALRSFEWWGRFPMPIPNSRLFKQHPLWSLYATAQSIALALLIVTLVVPWILLLRSALIRIWA
jgi:hypothetical protein